MPKRGRGRPPKAAALDMSCPRDFRCQICNKTYLSNPALYLHVKTKHCADLKPSGGTFEGKRSRGRPRKNFSQFDCNLEDSGRGENPYGPLFFMQEERKGGPTDPSSFFDEIVLALSLMQGKYKNTSNPHPMREYITSYAFS